MGGFSDNVYENQYDSYPRSQNFENVSFEPPQRASSNKQRSFGEDIHFEPPTLAGAPRQLPPLPAEVGGKKKKKKKLLKKLAHETHHEEDDF